MASLPASQPQLNQQQPALPSVVNQAEAPKPVSAALPEVPKFASYELPTMPAVKPVEKPTFGTYFEQNIKPVFQKMLTENLAQNPQLVQSFAKQYQQDIQPLTEQIGSSIYGRNVGATSGLGAEAFAKGMQKVMEPVTNYANQLNAQTIGRFQDTLNTLATQGAQQDYATALNEYNTAQDRMYQQGIQTYQDTLANKKYAAELANQAAQTGYSAKLTAAQTEAGLANQYGMAGYQNQLAQQNAVMQADIAKKQSEYQNALQQGNMTLANQLSKDLAASQETLRQQTQKQQQLFDLAMSGQLGDSGASIIQSQLGLTPEQSSALANSSRDSIIQSTLQSYITNNQAVDIRAIDALLSASGKAALTENEKQKYSAVTALPPSDAAAKLFNPEMSSAIKDQLDRFGFKHETEEVFAKPGDWFKSKRWNFNLPENTKLFNELWSSNPDFKSWVMTTV